MNEKIWHNYRKYKRRGYSHKGYGLSSKYKKVLFHYLVDGCGKREACVRAGISSYTSKDVFAHPLIKKAIIEHMENLEEGMTPEKAELIEFYRRIINSTVRSVKTVVRKYRPEKGTAGSTQKKLESEEITWRPVSDGDRINAAKELSVLLGLREEKSKVDVASNDLIRTIEKRRAQLRGEGDEQETA